MRESLQWLAGRWPHRHGERRVAVLVIDMDKGTATDAGRDGANVIEAQIQVLRAAKKLSLDVFEVWIDVPSVPIPQDSE